MNRIPFIDIADVNCWMIYLLPFRPEERGDYKRVDSLQDFCIKNRFFGMGWDVPCFEYGTAMSDENIEKYQTKYKETYGDETSKAALNDYRQIKKGDYVVFRRKNGHYYVGRVSSDVPFYLYKHGDSVYGQFSWGAEVEKWVEYANDSEVPGEIVGRFSQQRHPTIQRFATYRLRLLVIAMYENKNEKKNYTIPKLRIGKSNIIRSLHYLDLEDLVSDYIASKHEKEGYRLIPSSCKVSHPNYEFMYLAKGKKPITCQVKNQEEISVDRYISEEGYDRIYIFSGSWDESTVEEKRLKYKEYKFLSFIGPNELLETLKSRWDRNSDFYDYSSEPLSTYCLNLDGYNECDKPRKEQDYSISDDFVCFKQKDDFYFSSEFGALVLAWHIMEDREKEKKYVEKVWGDINRK